MIAQLHIQTACINGKTRLAQSFYTPPFKVIDITEDKQDRCLQLMIMNASPGILDGDNYKIKIELPDDCSLQLYTQSYQRLFNMQKGAGQLMELYVGKNASFVYLPHPAVPHEHSVFTTRNKFFLTEGSTLLWGEVLTCGRKLNGEVFRFSKYQSITEIFIGERLILKENLLMQPAVTDPKKLGQLEGFTHQASLIYIDDKQSVDSRQDQVYDYLSVQKEILGGVSATPVNGILIRILGHGAEQLYHHLQTIAMLLQQPKINSLLKPVYAE